MIGEVNHINAGGVLEDTDAGTSTAVTLPGPTPHGPVRRAVRAIASAALSARHGKTGEHSDEVVELCGVIADELAFGPHAREQLLLGAQLHDVGKLAIPREILDKPGGLDADEWALMRRHTVAGQEILASVPEMADVGVIVRHAHERWDGKGYPDGIGGEDIPLASRVIFCADAFHVIRSDRPYCAARSLDEALVEIDVNAGTQFDPRVAAALRSVATRARRGRGGLSSRALVLLLTLAVVGSAAAAIPGVRHAIRSLVGIDSAPRTKAPAPRKAPAHRAVPAPTATQAPTPAFAPTHRSRSGPPAAVARRPRHRLARPAPRAARTHARPSRPRTVSHVPKAVATPARGRRHGRDGGRGYQRGDHLRARPADPGRQRQRQHLHPRGHDRAPRGHLR